MDTNSLSLACHFDGLIDNEAKSNVYVGGKRKLKSVSRDSTFECLLQVCYDLTKSSCIDTNLALKYSFPGEESILFDLDCDEDFREMAMGTPANCRHIFVYIIKSPKDRFSTKPIVHESPKSPKDHRSNPLVEETPIRASYVAVNESSFILPDPNDRSPADMPWSGRPTRFNPDLLFLPSDPKFNCVNDTHSPEIFLFPSDPEESNPPDFDLPEPYDEIFEPDCIHGLNSDSSDGSGDTYGYGYNSSDGSMYSETSCKKMLSFAEEERTLLFYSSRKGDSNKPTPLEAKVVTIDNPPKMTLQKRKTNVDGHQPRWILPRRLVGEIIHEPLKPFTAKQLAEIEDKISIIQKDEGYVFPNGAKGSFLKLLLPGGWLDDEVVEPYLKVLKEREKRFPKYFEMCHFFSPFFLSYLEIFKSSKSKKVEEHRLTLQWMEKAHLGYDIIECKKLFFPLNRPDHWALLVLDVEKMHMSVYDSLGFNEPKDWKAPISLIKSHLDKFITRLGHTNLGCTKWKVLTESNIPLQSNGFDCGVFMLKYIDYLSRGSEMEFSQDQMPYFRHRMLLEMTNGMAYP